MKVCVICGKEFDGYGNNAEPVADGACCDSCNMLVITERLRHIGSPEAIIDRYENDVPDMLIGAHKDYVTGNIEAKDYAAALRKIYNTLEELYLGDK